MNFTDMMNVLETEIKTLEKQQKNAMESGYKDIAKMLEYRIFECRKLQQILFEERFFGGN